MQSVLRSRARPFALLISLTLILPFVIIPSSLACTPPDELFNLEMASSYEVDGVSPVASVRSGTDIFCASLPGLAVLDVTDPLVPSLAATAAAGGASGVDIDLEGTTVWMAADDGRVYVYDVSTPAAPSALGSFVVGSSINSVDVAAARLFVGTDDGLHVFDVSAPPSATQVGFYGTLEPVTDVVVAGDVLYLGYSYYSLLASTCTPQCYPTTVLALDISSDTPTLLDSHGVPDGWVKLAMSGDGQTLFTAISYPGGSSYLKVFDVSDPGVLSYVSMVYTGSKGALDIAVSGGMVLLGGTGDLKLYDMSDPRAVYLAGFSPAGATAVMWPDDGGVTFYGTNAETGWLDVYSYVPTSERSLGPTRYETAVDLNDEFKSSEYVVLATGAAFPDALTGAPLAYALNAPLLLVKPDEIPQAVKDKIVALGATKAYILGSQGAISDDVVTELEGLGMASGDVKRLAGLTRYDTATAIAMELKAIKGGGPLTKAFIATGEKFPDAMAASSVAAKMGCPILLVRQDSIPEATADALVALGVTDTVVLGGEGAVSDEVFSALPSPTRLEGTDRYGTAKAIADWALDSSGGGFSAADLFVVTGTSYPDAMPCGVVAANHDAVMVLVNADVPKATSSFVTTRKTSITGVRIVGGPGAVSSDVERVLVGLLD